MMIATVLRDLRHTDLVGKRPILDAYKRRCEERPAFRRAPADQLVGLAGNAPPPL
jgi:glutathione S-transferase